MNTSPTQLRATHPSIPEEPSNRDIMIELRKLGDRVTTLEGTTTTKTADLSATITNAIPAKWKVWTVAGAAAIGTILEIVRQLKGQ